MINTFNKKYACLCLFLIFFGMAHLVSAQLEVRASRANATYEAGETMYFEVISDTWGPVDYNIRFDPKLPPLVSGQIIASPGVPAKIPFTMHEPGSVFCRVTKGNVTTAGGAIFSRFDVKPYSPEPADFDQFWNGVKAELAAVPIDPVLTFLDSTALSETYRLNLGNINNRRVYGYISIPKGVPPPYPAMLTLPPFGVVPHIAIPENIISEWGGALSVSISIHNAEADEVDPDSYLPNDISDPNGIYYKQAITGAIRTIDYIFSRSDFNGVDMGVAGLSQGGGIAVMTAGVDQRVTSLTHTVSALLGHSGHRFNRASGLPLYIRDSRGTNGTIDHENLTLNATKYYDGIHFAKRFTGPTLSFISYADSISPLETVFSVTNNFRENGIIKHSITLGHDNPGDFWEVRFRFWRKVHPAMKVNPFPWTPNTEGYHADAGPDISIPSSGTANLSAIVKFNDDLLPNLEARWMLVDGPGKVGFSDATTYNTTATFSQDGEYTFRFVATESSTLDSEDFFYTIFDIVKVTVGN